MPDKPDQPKMQFEIRWLMFVLLVAALGFAFVRGLPPPSPGETWGRAISVVLGYEIVVTSMLFWIRDLSRIVLLLIVLVFPSRSRSGRTDWDGKFPRAALIVLLVVIPMGLGAFILSQNVLG